MMFIFNNKKYLPIGITSHKLTEICKNKRMITVDGKPYKLAAK